MPTGLVWNCDPGTPLPVAMADPPSLEVKMCPSTATIRLLFDELPWHEYGFEASPLKLTVAFDPKLARLFIAGGKTRRRTQLALDLRQQLIAQHRRQTFRVVG